MNHKIIRTALALLFVSLLIAAPRAQQPAPVATTQSPEDRIALYQALLDLTNPWTVMCIAAHPDDEDGTSLIVMRRKYGAHTVSVFSTFGEGGQNAIGPELYEELGAIRARETMAAAEIQGSEPYFLGLRDFGYSKSAEEAFRIWGHDEALRRMVLQIRKLRPDVIITNHSVTNNDHGHHQATARLELEAFDAAADPTRFPEQLKDGVTNWQVQRLFVRVRGNQGQKPDREGGREEIVTIDPNERDPIRDTTFAEEALRALQQHATQGPWPKTLVEMAARFLRSSDGKPPLIRYRLVREAKGAEALPKDSHNFLDELRLPENVEEVLKPPTVDGKALFEFSDQPSRAFDALLAAARNSYGSLGNFLRYPHEPHITRMVSRIHQALATTAGLRMRFIPSQTVLAPNTLSSFSLELTNVGDRVINVDRVSIPAESPSINSATSSLLQPRATMSVTNNIRTPRDTRINLPQSAHLYDENPFGPVITAGIYLHIDDAQVFLTASRQVDIAPAVEISSISPSSLVITPQTGNVSKTVILEVINHQKAGARTTIETVAMRNAPEEANRMRITETPLTLAPNERREVKITLPMKTKTVLTVRTTRVSIIPAQTSPTIQEPPPVAPARRLLFRTTDKSSNEVAVPFVYADARVAPNLRVGYIRGFDYSLPNALIALGVESKELSINDVRTGDLQKYAAVIVDNRVYESQPELIVANQKLLDYAKDGGTLIVFYHKTNEWNPDPKRNRPQLAPFNLVLGDERITDENAPITFIEPQHPLLNFPNKMGQEDFAGWIQERGLYYPKEWDSHYTALLASNDSGEQPLRGGLLVADYGRGHYIYTSMVWYRQLRAGVPGAYRMLANMVSYGRPTN
jgi:LmbE family N-acetylglucosaminyl deacetylase